MWRPAGAGRRALGPPHTLGGARLQLEDHCAIGGGYDAVGLHRAAVPVLRLHRWAGHADGRKHAAAVKKLGLNTKRLCLTMMLAARRQPRFCCCCKLFAACTTAQANLSALRAALSTPPLDLSKFMSHEVSVTAEWLSMAGATVVRVLTFWRGKSAAGGGKGGDGGGKEAGHSDGALAARKLGLSQPPTDQRRSWLDWVRGPAAAVLTVMRCSKFW